MGNEKARHIPLQPKKAETNVEITTEEIPAGIFHTEDVRRAADARRMPRKTDKGPRPRPQHRLDPSSGTAEKSRAPTIRDVVRAHTRLHGGAGPSAAAEARGCGRRPTPS